MGDNGEALGVVGDENCAREEELAGGGGSRLRAGDGEGQRGGLGLYRQVAAVYKEGEWGAR